MKFAAVAFVILIIAPNAFAQPSAIPDTIQFLYQVCKTEIASGTPRFCLGYIEAAGELMVLNGYERQKVPAADTEAQMHLSNFGLCPPPPIGVPSGGAMIQAFLNWADRHPESWANHALSGVAFALAETWPCRK